MSASANRSSSKTYVFKVEFWWKRELWRTIEVREDQTLDNLHRVIQDAFGWDNDHPYLFSLETRRTEKFNNPDVEYLDPRVESQFGQRSAGDAIIGSLGLRPRRRFRYLFDFGDNLRHQVTVVRIAAADPRAKYPRIVEKHGRNAPQYSLW